MSNIKYLIRQRNFFYNDEGQYLTNPEFDGCEGYGDIEQIEDSLGSTTLRNKKHSIYAQC